MEIRTNVRVLEITDEHIIMANENGEESTLDADTIVIGVGLKPNNALVEILKNRVPELYAIGDCAKPRRVLNAIWQGFRMARLI